MVRREAGRYLVVTDGALTEKTYFERINQIVHDTLLVKRVKHTKDLVKKAIAMHEAGGFDRTFIVCDIDEHCKNKNSRLAFEAMVADATAHGIDFLCSNECFEIWLIAHKSIVPAESRGRRIAQTIVRQLGLVANNNTKIIVPKEITSVSVDRASKEAKRLRKTYGSSVLDSNPVTDVDRVIDLLEFQI